MAAGYCQGDKVCLILFPPVTDLKEGGPQVVWGEIVPREKRSQDTPIKGGEIKMGSAVVAEWEGNLYRGVVTAKVGSRLLVFFVDWGNADLVGEHKVRLALQTEMQEPQLALR